MSLTWLCRLVIVYFSFMLLRAGYLASSISAQQIFFLGVPFNIASYALLTHMIAHVTSLQVGDFVHTLGDAHLYLNHMEQAELQLTRKAGALPQLALIDPPDTLDAFRFDHFKITDYEAAPSIAAPIAV